MTIQVLTAAEGAAWEAPLVAAFAPGQGPGSELEITRRCVDVVELLSVASAGQAQAALVDARLRRFDVDAVDRLAAAGVAVVGVTRPGERTDEGHLAALGVRHLVPAGAEAEVVASVVAVAVAQLGEDAAGLSRAYSDPAQGAELAGRRSASRPASEPSSILLSPGTSADGSRGSVIAVWGPTGAPGRSTVACALADELARLAVTALLVDADVYGGSLACLLGVLDDAPGIAAACRLAQSRRLDVVGLAELCFQLRPTLRVLTGLTRADRWPELRVSALGEVLAVARSLAAVTVVDLGFCLESDEELSFDTLAPRRNGATLAVLDEADIILVVASADPLGMQRLIRALSELADAEVEAPVRVVLNRVRKSAVPGEPAVELERALQRFAGRSAEALLPYDQTSLDRCVALGQTLAEAAPASALRQAVRALAAQLVGVEPPARGRRRSSRA